MKPLVWLGCLLIVMGLAFWAYRENYRTQAAISEMAQVRREIALLRDELGVLRAEWAYLNRPARLRELVDLNFDRLQLVPLAAGQSVDLNNIDFPAPPPPAPVAPDAVATQEQQP